MRQRGSVLQSQLPRQIWIHPDTVQFNPVKAAALHDRAFFEATVGGNAVSLYDYGDGQWRSFSAS